MLVMLLGLLGVIPAVGLAADSAWLYGIHWWGYEQGQAVDGTPATLLDCPSYGGWDVETVMTHSDWWWGDDYFLPLYQNLAGSRNMTMITRIDYQWGHTVPAPGSGDYAGWANSCVGVVDTLRNYCHIWVIGNEPNLTIEGQGWPSSRVTPEGYAQVYRNVRSAIHSSAGSSLLGSHIVLVAGVSPGGVDGERWMAGNDYLAQVIDNIPAAELDGLAIHAYGDAGLATFQSQYQSQLAVIDNKGLTGRPVYMTEAGRAAEPGDSSGEAAAAQFCRDAFADVRTWNQGAGHHNVICLCWFVYDGNQQAANQWNRRSIEYWRNDGYALGNNNDLFTAFQQTVDLRYPAGASGGGSGGGVSGELVEGVPGGTNLATSATQVAADSQNSSGEAASKAIDGVIAADHKWTSASSAPPHWLKLDLGSSKTVYGFVVRHAGAAEENPSYNTRVFKIQSGTSYDGPWADEGTVNNAAGLSVTNLKYNTSKTLRYVRLYITTASAVDNYARIPEFEVYGQASGGATNVAENFEAMPSWDSSFNASWGGQATWSITSLGQTGNGLQVQRTNAGSSVKVKYYDISASTNYTISIYIRCPSASNYWAECAFKLGQNTGQSFDESAGTWTMIKKFSNSGTNGNGDVYTKYETTFSSSSSTKISVGFKLGSSDGNAPIVRYDTLRITAQTGGGSATISRAPAVLSPSANQGSSPPAGSFTVANSGSGTLSYNITDNMSWLTVTPSYGTSTGEADTITVNYSTASLADGTYSGTITITDASATNSPQTIAVTLTVMQPGEYGPNLLANPSFEDGFSNGLASWWQSWSTSGSGYVKQSARLGRIGVGLYNGTVGYTQTLRINPKVILCSDLALGHAPSLRSALPDAFIMGRLYIDHLTSQYLSDPVTYGRQHAQNCYNAHVDKGSAFSAWHGMCEQFNSVDPYDQKAKKVAQFEKAFAERCHELGLKAVVMNIAVGNPGDMSYMTRQEVVDCLAVADYVGYHSYGGVQNQLMIDPPGGPEEEPWFSLRWRTYKDMYDDASYRMPPVVYTEGTTFYAWYGVFTAAQIRDDLIAFEAETKKDPWSVGQSLFLMGSHSSQWDGWDVSSQPTIYEGCGDYNWVHPADAWDGIYSQQFGENSGGYTGGIVQVASVAPGTDYQLAHSMKYETYGVNTDVSYYVGYDLSGQSSNPGASTIVWTTDLIDGQDRETDWWYEHAILFTATQPQVSIWFKASQPTGKNKWRVMVDDVSLRAVNEPDQPVISRSPAELSPSCNQGGNSAAESFTVDNAGVGTLTYTITDDASWLSVNPSEGTSAGEEDTITVSYSAASLSAGTYIGTITISDPAASNDPQTVVVTLTVHGSSPTISRQPTTLSPSTPQGSSPPAGSFTVANSGDGTLQYSITDNASWLSVTPASGNSTGEIDTITVNYSTSGLSAGTYNATITISDANATNNPQTIAVTLTVTAVFSGETNGNFEGGSYNNPDGDHVSPNNWTRFSVSGASKTAVPWLGSNAHSPNYVYEVYESSWVAGLYQQITGTVQSGYYTGKVWVRGDADVQFRIGIDPNGGTDAASANVQWSDPSVPGGTWTQISKQVQANGTTITVFLKAQNPYAANRYARFDDVDVTSP